jgi:hypothetical protein
MSRKRSRISAEDRLRVCAFLQAEFGNSDMAEILCKVAETQGVEQTLLDFNRALAHPKMQSDRPPS